MRFKNVRNESLLKSLKIVPLLNYLVFLKLHPTSNLAFHERQLHIYGIDWRSIFSNISLIGIYRLCSCTFLLSFSKLKGQSFLSLLIAWMFSISLSFSWVFTKFLSSFRNADTGTRAIVGVPPWRREGGKKWEGMSVFSFFFFLHHISPSNHIFFTVSWALTDFLAWSQLFSKARKEFPKLEVCLVELTLASSAR